MFDTNKLDSHGKLSIVELAFYVPAILFCIFNNIRYGFRREAGWIYLSIFCISMYKYCMTRGEYAAIKSLTEA